VNGRPPARCAAGLVGFAPGQGWRRGPRDSAATPPPSVDARRRCDRRHSARPARTYRKRSTPHPGAPAAPGARAARSARPRSYAAPGPKRAGANEPRRRPLARAAARAPRPGGAGAGPARPLSLGERGGRPCEEVTASGPSRREGQRQRPLNLSTRRPDSAPPPFPLSRHASPGGLRPGGGASDPEDRGAGLFASSRGGAAPHARAATLRCPRTRLR
jgi:hypothetical protein